MRFLNSPRWYFNGKGLAIVVFLLMFSAQAAEFNVCEDGCNYTSIQEAIIAASAGDAVKIYSGTYYEYVNVNKQLTLSGLDSGAGLPIVDAGGSGSPITLSANGTTLEGLVAMNSAGSSEGGIKVESSDNIIMLNTARGNEYNGIYLVGGRNNTILANNASNNYYGIYLTNSDQNIIANNIAGNNSDTGIYMRDSNSNLLFLNKLSGNAQYNVYDRGYNEWDKDKIGNYYSGINCVDADKNGICDKPYRIPPGNQREGKFSIDRYPLASWSSMTALPAAEVWNNKGSELLLSGKYDESLLYFERAITLDQNFTSPWNNRGKALFALGRYNESVEAYDQAISINPDFAIPWNNKGEALFALGEYNKSIESYDQAIQIEGFNPLFRFNKGMALLSMGSYNESNYNESILYFNDVLLFNPDDTMSLAKRGSALFALGEYTRSLDDFNRVIELDPENAEALKGKEDALKALEQE